MRFFCLFVYVFVFIRSLGIFRLLSCHVKDQADSIQRPKSKISQGHVHSSLLYFRLTASYVLVIIVITLVITASGAGNNHLLTGCP